MAAFFAFQPLTGSNSRVAIFVYQERTNDEVTHNNTYPQIRQLPEHVRTHARHFRQQCEYTVCLQYGGDEHKEAAHSGLPNNFYYWRHEDIIGELNLFNGESHRDRLWKFTLPRTERAKVMPLLNDFNLNAHSLFGSEDSLMSTLAEKEIHPLA